MLSITPELLAAIQGNYPPYINLVFHDRDDNNTEDFSLANDATNRIMDIQWHEKMYDGYGFIKLRNNDLAVPDLRGWWVEPGFGADTSGFGGSGNEYIKRARMWVTNQHKVSAPGHQYVTLFLEGIMRRLARHIVVTLIEPPIRSTTPWTDITVYQLIKYLLEINLSIQGRSYMTATLDALGDQDDGIINSFTPYIEVNQFYQEPSGEVIQRGLNLTECYLRARAGLNFEIRWLQDSDAVDATYYSDQVPNFHSWTESESVLIPNHVVFLGARDENGLLLFRPIVVSDIADNEEKVWVTVDMANVTSEAELTAYTNSYLKRIKGRRVAGRMIIRVDPRLEVHDKIRIEDNR